jgi:ERG8-type phosphomevalonate kinase
LKIWAPGKNLIYGGYTILEVGREGLVVPVNKGVTAEIEEADEIVLNMPQFKIAGKRASFDGKKLSCDVSDEERKKMSFLLGSVESALLYISSRGMKPKGFTLTTTNDEGMTYQFGESKAGFGTSSASTVAAVASLLAFHGFGIYTLEKRQLVNKIAQYVHYIIQGNVGSGFDVSCACFGPHFFKRASPKLILESRDVVVAVSREWDNGYERAPWPSFFTSLMAFTGRSASTSEAVKKTKAFREISPENEARYQEFIRKNDAVNNKLHALWNEVSKYKSAGEAGAKLAELKTLLKQSWRQRKEMGEMTGVEVETDDDTALLEGCEQNGALFATMPGSGGGDSVFAVCTSRGDRARLARFLKSKGLGVFEEVETIGTGYIQK